MENRLARSALLGVLRSHSDDDDLLVVASGSAHLCRSLLFGPDGLAWEVMPPAGQSPAPASWTIAAVSQSTVRCLIAKQWLMPGQCPTAATNVIGGIDDLHRVLRRPPSGHHVVVQRRSGDPARTVTLVLACLSAPFDTTSIESAPDVLRSICHPTTTTASGTRRRNPTVVRVSDQARICTIVVVDDSMTASDIGIAMRQGGVAPGRDGPQADLDRLRLLLRSCKALCTSKDAAIQHLERAWRPDKPQHETPGRHRVRFVADVASSEASLTDSDVDARDNDDDDNGPGAAAAAAGEPDPIALVDIDDDLGLLDLIEDARSRRCEANAATQTGPIARLDEVPDPMRIADGIARLHDLVESCRSIIDDQQAMIDVLQGDLEQADVERCRRPSIRPSPVALMGIAAQPGASTDAGTMTTQPSYVDAAVATDSPSALDDDNVADEVDSSRSQSDASAAWSSSMKQTTTTSLSGSTGRASADLAGSSGADDRCCRPGRRRRLMQTSIGGRLRQLLFKCTTLPPVPSLSPASDE